DLEPSNTPEPPTTTTTTGIFDWWTIIDIPGVPGPSKLLAIPTPAVNESTINYTALFKLKIISILLTPSVLFKNCQTQLEKLASKTVNSRFCITFKDEYNNSHFEYFAAAETTITSILTRFILDQQLKFTLPETYFSVFDSLGRYIAEDGQLNTLYRADEQSPIYIRIFQCSQDKNICYKITIVEGQDETHHQHFNPTTTWQQISLWTKILNNKTETPVDKYYFWNTEQKHIINEDEAISFTVGQVESIIVDVLNGESVIDINLSYDKNIQTIHLLNSCPVSSLLNNPKYLQQLDLKISSQDCTLVFILNDSEKQIP
ncbi:unnamed protein product, partial [Rotaria sp. Silwood1]